MNLLASNWRMKHKWFSYTMVENQLVHLMQHSRTCTCVELNTKQVVFHKIIRLAKVNKVVVLP